jgi:D-alanyl-D-alanine carboxypeptidase
MVKLRASVAVIAAVLVAVAATTAPAATPTRQAKLRQLAQSLVRGGAPGAIVFVRAPSTTRSAVSGFSSLEPRVPMRASDRFRVASITKTFVATIVLQLEAEGKLDIDDPVERWLPGRVPNGPSITLRELLNHTSGIFNYTDDQAFIGGLIANPSRARSPGELLSVAFSHAALFAPGTNWSYSNTNFILLGLVIEAVTGTPIEQELQQRIFGPLALGATSFPSGLSVDGPFVHGYLGDPAGGSSLLDITPLLSPTWAWAAGAIVSTAANVTTFYAALLRGRLLPAAQLAEMKAPSPVVGTYGLGLTLTSTRCGRAVGHEGDFFGYRSIALATPNGRREAVVMVNVDESRVNWSRLEAGAGIALCSG